MLSDFNARVSSAQAITGAAAVVSTNSIDLKAAIDAGLGEDLVAVISPLASLAGATAMTFQVIGATNALLTTGVVVLGSTDALPAAQLAVPAVTGTLPARPIVVCINPRMLDASSGLRYLGVRYVPTGTVTTGTYTADFVPEPSATAMTYYPSNTSGAF